VDGGVSEHSASGVSLSAASLPATQTAQPGPVFSALIAGESPGYTTMIGTGPFMPPAMPVLIEGPVSITQAPGAQVEMPAWVTPGQPNVSIELPAIYSPGQSNTLMQPAAVIGAGQISPAAFFGPNQSQAAGQGADPDFGDLVAHRLGRGHRWNYDASGRRDAGGAVVKPGLMDPFFDWWARYSMDENGQYVGIGQPGFWEGMIPIWGSSRALIDDLQNRRYGRAAIDGVLLGLDVTGGPALIKLFWGIGRRAAAGASRRFLITIDREVAEGLANEGRQLTRPNTTRGWKPGDPINNLTKPGNIPSSDAVRQRFWKNEALQHPDKYSPENLQRLQKGLAPQRKNPTTGEIESMELHHDPPRREGGLFDVKPYWPDDHAAIDPYRHTGR
jgi:hypothetical protein